MAAQSKRGVRCQNPKCGAKLAEWVRGEAGFTCPKCGTEQTVRRPVKTAPWEYVGVNDLGPVRVQMHRTPYAGDDAPDF